MRILAAEGDNAVLKSIEMMLGTEGWHVYGTTEGSECLELGKLYDYDAITIELNMPDMSGADVIRKLRAAKIKTPILVLSGLAGIEDKVKAFGIGADAYITKPFHKDELCAQLTALVRRSRGQAQSRLTVDNVVLNLNSRTVEVAGAPVHLTTKEYKMLELLMLRQGQTLTKEMFLNHLYGMANDEPEMKIIDVFICKLRKKLAAAGALTGLLETVWGRGYVIRPDAPSMAPELREMAGMGARGGETLHLNGMTRHSGAV